MNFPPPLLAINWEEILSFAVGVVVLIVWLVNQISDAKRKQGGAPPPPVEARPQPQRPQPMAEAAAPPDPLRTQIDEFLRRANQPGQPAGRQAQGEASAQRQPAQDEIVVLLDEAPTEPRRGPLTPTLRPAAAQPVRRPRREKRPKDARGKSVAEHVAERIGSSSQQFREEVADLGSRVIQADKQFDAQLEQKFSHQLGTLGQTATSTAYDTRVADTNSPAAQIAAMLATPDGIRQAMLVNEILRRPSDRW
jgi:hypothetical protein